MASACPASAVDESKQHKKQGELVSDAEGNSHTIRRASVSHRCHPYALVLKSFHGSSETQVQQLDSLPAALTHPPIVWQAADHFELPHQQDQLRQLALAGTLRDQPLEKLLDIAISLASCSLARTMDAFQAACQCWAYDADSEVAGQALDRAESCMNRTLHRMQIAQHLAAALIHRQQQCHQQVQQAEYGKMLHMMQTLQRQQLFVVEEAEDEGEEEVCSSWRPAPADQ